MSGLSPSDFNILQKFRAKAREFANAYRDLQGQAAYVARNPALARKYAELLEDGRGIAEKIRTVTRAIDAANAWIAENTGLNAVGVIPLLPVAIVGIAGAAVYAMNTWLPDYMLFRQQVEEAKRLEERGVPPEKAAILARQKYREGILRQLKPLFFIAAAAVIVPPIVERIKKR